MEDNNTNQPSTREAQVRLIIDFIHRTLMHHALWFAEVSHQLGKERALAIMKTVYDRTLSVQLNRLGKVVGFDLSEGGLPMPLLNKSDEELARLTGGLAANWLANDGIWFQAVEHEKGMNDAKRCNDSCWAQFSPFEAWSIKKMLSLPEKPGLEGLKKAIGLRLYAFINKQSFAEEKEDSFVFRMDDCRVQSARKRKGLEDYPCKSGGLVEYASFAEAIDPRIKTECICCPPDPHPGEYFCAWRFCIL